jgi:hypothetical protein
MKKKDLASTGNPDSERQATTAYRIAWIGAASGILAALIAAGFGPIFSYLGAQSGAATPAVRIDSIEWDSPARHAFTLSGTTQNVSDDSRLWAYSSITEGTGRQYPTDDDCDRYSDGTFVCKGYAGDPEEGGRNFTLTVSVVTTEMADEIRDRRGRPWDSVRDTPVVDGQWSLHSLTVMRPQPDAQ